MVNATQTIKALAIKSGMNDSTVAVATFIICPPATYTLTVNSGTGSGTYTAGTVVNIAANAPVAGKVFDQWTGATVADATAASTTLTMPAANTTVTATYKDAPPPPILDDAGEGNEIAAGVITIPGKNIQIIKCSALNQLGFIAGTAVAPVGSKVAIVINVAGWWTKSYFFPISKCGKWKVKLEGMDYAATKIRAYLLPPSMAVPLMSGGIFLDDRYNQYEYAKVIRTFAIKSIKVMPKKISLYPGRAFFMTDSVIGKDKKPLIYMNPYIVWTSADNNIATIDQKGAIKAILPGATQVIATTTVDPSVQTVIPITVK